VLFHSRNLNITDVVYGFMVSIGCLEYHSQFCV